MIFIVKTDDPAMLSQIQALVKQSKHSILVEDISLTVEQEVAIVLSSLGISSCEPCFKVMVEAVSFCINYPNLKKAKEMYAHISKKLSISKYACQEAVSTGKEIIRSQRTLPDIIGRSFEHARTNNLVGLVRKIAAYVVHLRHTEKNKIQQFPPSLVVNHFVRKTLDDLKMQDDDCWLFLTIIYAVEHSDLISCPSVIRRNVAIERLIKVNTLDRHLNNAIRATWLRNEASALRSELFDPYERPSVSEFIQTVSKYILKKYISFE